MQIPSKISDVKKFRIVSESENSGECLAEIKNPLYGKRQYDVQIGVLKNLLSSFKDNHRGW